MLLFYKRAIQRNSRVFLHAARNRLRDSRIQKDPAAGPRRRILMSSIQVIRFPLLVLTLKMCDCGLTPRDSKTFCCYVTFLLYPKSSACLWFFDVFLGSFCTSPDLSCYIVLQYNSETMENTMHSSQKIKRTVHAIFRNYNTLRMMQSKANFNRVTFTLLFITCSTELQCNFFRKNAKFYKIMIATEK